MKKIPALKNTEVKISSLKRKRTFTIYFNGSRYRTNQLLKNDFEDMQYYSCIDWIDFLRKSNNYYKVR
jgi:hypothetical protein